MHSDDLTAHWDFISKNIDYTPIFDVAVKLVAELPSDEDVEAAVLSVLTRVPRRIAEPHPIASHSACSAAEDQPEHDSDPECREDRSRRIFPDILLAVFLKSARPIACVTPHLLSFAAIFFSHRARRRLQVIGCRADLGFGTLEFLLRSCRNGAGAYSGFVFFSHDIFLWIQFRPSLPLRLFHRTPSVI